MKKGDGCSEMQMDEGFICDSLDIDEKMLNACVAGSGRNKLKKKLAAYEYKSFLTGYIKLLDAVAEGDAKSAKAYAEYRDILFPATKEDEIKPRGGVIILPEVMMRTVDESSEKDDVDGKERGV